jgi:hypothetical protein
MNTKKPVEDHIDEVDAFVKGQSTSAMVDAEQAAEAAVQEAEYEMMAAEAAGDIRNISSEAGVAENKLRQVQMEEVEDEDM